MRKFWLFVGVVLLVAGVVVSSWSQQFIEYPEPVQVSSAENTYEISGTYEVGEKIFVDWKSPDWEEIGVAIPNGEWVIYYITFLAPPPGNGETNFTVKLFNSGGVDVTVTSSTGGLSNFTSNLIGGVAQSNGEYTVRMDELGKNYHNNAPPAYMRLWTETIKREYRQLDALPIGVALIVMGAPLSIWAARSSKRTSESRKKKG